MGLKDFLFNNDYSFLLQIAIILLSTKLLGLLTKRISLPQVVGALAAGIILGPMLLDVVERNDLIVSLAELGVIVLMFSAGLETDIQELKKAGLASFVIALLGVIVPLVGGFFLADFYNTEQNPEMASLFWQNIFIGVVLTATSVSITVETLKEIGKLDTKVGNTILAAALIDDVLGLIALTIVSSLSGGQDSIALVLLKIVLFFVFSAVVSFLAHKFFCWLMALWPGRERRRYPVLAFVLCLLMAYCAEEFFGVADITGAYVAGLVISCTPKSSYIQSKFEPLSFLLLTPVFFASVGIKAKVDGMTGSLVLFSILLLLISVATKIVGCGLGAKLCHFTGKESLQVGVGMVCRGEVALIVANRGLELGVLSGTLMAPVIITVVGGTILTPILLKLVFRHDGQPASAADSNLADHYEKMEQLDIVSAELLARDQKYLKEGEHGGDKDRG